ncbi:DEAD-domain-containing protein [Atractiella rhizophila]|nr:DEAD-domain-containing protein [Atractiella rhizophila]
MVHQFFIIKTHFVPGRNCTVPPPSPRLPGRPDPDPPSSCRLIENAEFGVKLRGAFRPPPRIRDDTDPSLPLSLNCHPTDVVPSAFSLTRHQPLAFSFTSFNRTYAIAPEAESEAQESSAPETEAAPQGRKWSTVESAIHPGLYKALTTALFSFKHMSPVQEAVISLLERGSANPSPPTPDLLVKTKTGTGKTVSFLIPAIESRIKSLSLQAEAYRAAHPGANQKEVDAHVRKFAPESTGTLNLSPTTELATQIANEAIKFVLSSSWIPGTAFGRRYKQKTSGRRDIVVATPGRMNDLLITEPMVESSVAVSERLILDEADTLLRMGFKDEIKRIMLKMPPKQKRQTFMFSATLENEVKEVACAALNPKPLFINTVMSNENKTHTHVPQYATVVDSPTDVFPHIMRLIAQDQLENPKGRKAIIFLPTTKYTETFAQVAAALRRDLPFFQVNSRLRGRVRESNSRRENV